ncbi:MAG: ABC transporter ATP-binding protein [Propionibacteriaceae bacterium]|nr:ABC transporter ATP-binding protein [Propionibacteriaceae bacterium]
MIELTEVVKRYGSVAAIDDFNLRLPDQGIYCLLGRNGAGKTTLMKLLAGHIGATAGRVVVDGRAVSPARMPEAVRFIESGSVQFNMSAGALIRAAAALQEDFDEAFAEDMARRFDLRLDKRFKQLSFGMKTMLTAIMTLADNSKVALLDEPTLGFDAITRAQFSELLLESYAAHPRLLIVSTHLIDEIAKVAERFLIIDQGRLLLEAGVDDIDERAYILSGPAAAVRPLLADLNCIGQVTAGSVMAAHIFDRRVTPPPGVAVDRLGLQEFFIDLVGGNSHA